MIHVAGTRAEVVACECVWEVYRMSLEVAADPAMLGSQEEGVPMLEVNMASSICLSARPRC